MAPRLFLHVGMAKTGTTAIQNALHANREALAANGLLYPSFRPNHIALHLVARGGTAYDRLLEPTLFSTLPDQKAHVAEAVASTEAELAAFTGETVIMSTEFLQYVTPEDHRRLFAWLSPFFEDITVVCYVRHPVAHAVSLAQQRLLDRAVTVAQVDADPPVMRPKPVIEAWTALVGRERMVVRAYDRGLLHRGSSVADILTVAGYRGDPSAIETVTANESMSMAAALLASEVVAGEGSLRLKRRVIRAAADGPKFALPAAALETVRARTAEDLRYLAEEWSLALPEPAVAAREDLGPVTVEAGVASRILSIAMAEAAGAAPAAGPGRDRPHPETRRAS